MTELSILQPTVLRGVIERFTTPETLRLLNSTPRASHPYPVATWEQIGGARNIAKPNVPNSEAHIVPRLGRTQRSASFVYLREKKVFEPTTLHWLRQVATTNDDLARTNAEKAVIREAADLNQRFDNFAEYLLWQSLTGKLTFDYNDVQTEVDYGLHPDSVKEASAAWNGATATPKTLVADIRALKDEVMKQGRVAATDAYTSSAVVDMIFDAYANASDGAATGAMLSDRMKDQYYSTGTLPGFMGLNWNIQDAVYSVTDSDGSSTPAEEERFLAKNSIIVANLETNRPLELMEGPTADDEAPSGYTGKFSKTWKDKDPSARQLLLEWNLLPILSRPEQTAHIKDVTA